MGKFGIYLNQIRIDRKISQREFAKMLSMRQINAVKLLKGEINAPGKTQRERVYKALSLSKEEVLKLEKEALKERKEISPEISRYLSSCPSATDAVALAMDMGEGNDFWEEVRLWLTRMNDK